MTLYELAMMLWLQVSRPTCQFAQRDRKTYENMKGPHCGAPGQPTIMPLELPEPLGPKLFIWGEPVLSASDKGNGSVEHYGAMSCNRFLSHK